MISKGTYHCVCVMCITVMKLFQNFILTEDDLVDDETFDSKIFMVPELRVKDQFDAILSGDKMAFVHVLSIRK